MKGDNDSAKYVIALPSEQVERLEHAIRSRMGLDNRNPDVPFWTESNEEFSPANFRKVLTGIIRRLYNMQDKTFLFVSGS